MKAKLLIQEAPASGEINLFFVTDPTARIEDCLVESEGWKPLQWTAISVEVTAQEESLLKLLENREFRAVTNSEPEHSMEIALNTDRELEIASRHRDNVDRALKAL